MKKISAAFGGLPMTWPIVCGFAVIIGIYVGVINQIPILHDTSFRTLQSRSSGGCCLRF